jgi:hypothetical protein
MCRRALVAATVIATLTGCYTFRPVSRVTPESYVRIRFAEVERDITVVTRDSTRVVVPRVRQASGPVTNVRGDSVAISIYDIRPWNNAARGSILTLATPAPKSDDFWDARTFSGKRTALLFSGTAAIGIGILIISLSQHPLMGN